MNEEEGSVECGTTRNERDIWDHYCRRREDPEEDGSVCLQCVSCPCEWTTYGDDIEDVSKEMYPEEAVLVNNNKKRKSMYRLYTYVKYGHLGKKIRIPIPICILENIREMFPSSDGKYMGHMYNNNNSY